MKIDVAPVKIRAIKRITAEPVYDVQVENNHNFFANRHLVHNCLIFQEQVMTLVEIVGGFPKDQCDKVRKAIMKRSISGGEEARKKAQEMEETFVKGAIERGVLESTARDAYQKILYYAGYGFNLPHATAYAIDSYMCAWLLTYHEEAWLCAYLESMSSNPEDKAVAQSVIRSMGYSIEPIDINHAARGWTSLPGKRFMPSFLSVAGLGEAAYEEIESNRPYNTLQELLWNDDFEWRHSKFNKKALEALIKGRALRSLDCVGPGKLFGSWRHMHHVLIECANDVKKTSKRDEFIGLKNLYNLAAETRDAFPEWSRKEIVENQVEVFGSFDVAELLPPEQLAALEKRSIKSLDAYETRDVYWFVVVSSQIKKTKNGKSYLVAQAMGLSGKQIRLNVWGWGDKLLAPLSVCVAEVDKNDFGYATNSWKLKVIGE